MRQLFLGVDGGQSSTTALIGNETGAVLGAGSGGPCNHVGAAEGSARLSCAVRECVGQACRQAGLAPDRVHFRAACFGMSGGPADKRAVLSAILSTAQLVVTDDASIALSGALAGAPGVIAISGTGTIAFGRNAQGKMARAGGWGYVFGDEGSAFDLVRQAIRAALRFEEGWGPPTVLRETLNTAVKAADANEMLHLMYTVDWPRSRAAKLAKLVDQAAADGDDVARELLTDAARQLASLAGAVAGQLWRPGETVNVAYIGGGFRSRILLDRYRASIEAAGYRCTPPLFPPAGGALFEAYRAAGMNVLLTGLPDLKS
ncbi:MAG: ATPase [Acidobacteriota bacterium]|nr:ATPase [Acidobacteriota bacterium]